MNIVEVRNVYLSKTLKYASNNIPQYKKFKNSASLNDFPLLESSLILDSPELFINYKVKPSFFGFSSGTSGSNKGKVKMVQHTNDSFNALKEYWKQQVSDDESFKVVLDRGTNGILPPNINSNVIRVQSGRQNTFAVVKDLIANGVPSSNKKEPITVLSTPVANLKAFTTYLDNNNFDFSLSSLKYIITYSEHLSSFWEERIMKKWKVAKVIKIFGLSEFFMGNAVLADDGYYYFPATVFPEVIDFNGKNITSSVGIGELVLSHLYPFMERQLLMRYKTGDIVRYNISSNGNIGIYPLGRFYNTFIFNNQMVLGANEIVENIEDLPDIGRTTISYFDDNQYPNLGQLIFQKESNNLLIELNYRPSLFPERVKELNKIIIKRLSKQINIKPFPISISFVSPGTIKDRAYY